MHLSQPIIIAIIAMLLIPLWRLLRNDFETGFVYAVFLCVSMPTYLRIALPGDLPQLTIHRLIVMSLCVFWIRNRADLGRLSDVPFFKPLVFWVVVSALSLAFTSISFTTSFKRFLDFVLEICVFYFVLATTIQTPEAAIRVVRGAWMGVTFVAGLALLERYTGINPTYWLTGEVFESRHDVVATYQHRILLGTGMAMAFPLAFGLMRSVWGESPRRWVLWVSVLMIIAASYFGQSRGPWIAAILAGMVMMWGGGEYIRKKLVMLGVLALMGLLMRPGVVETLSDRIEQSADSSSFKGGTLQYRLELWKVAWAQVVKSPQTFFFGYGPGCGSETEIDWNLSYRNQQYEISSWDNQFAYDLFQSGLLGLCASLWLYGSVVFSLYQRWRWAWWPNSELMACFLASALALVFMMTNVMIFAKQLNYLFWCIVATSAVLGLADRPTEDRDVESESEEVETVSPGGFANLKTT